jgi:mercuric ion transport protein
MKDATILKTGSVDAAVAAICCATPALVLTLAARGLSAWSGGLDYVLLPALAVFLGLTANGLWRRNRAAGCCDTQIGSAEERA